MPASNREIQIRRQVCAELQAAHNTLRRFPDVTSSLDDIAAAEAAFGQLCRHLADAAGANRMLRELDDITRDALMSVGATDAALLLLREALTEIAAELDYARTVAA